MSRYGVSNSNWAGSGIRSYEGAHRRVKNTRGFACTKACSSCGAPADEWAYQHGCDEEKVCPRINRPFCPHPEHYSPMCRKCHRSMDVKSDTGAKISASVAQAPRDSAGRYTKRCEGDN